MLDGHEGLAKQKAMEFIVRNGKVIGAEKLCPVTWADLFCGSHAYLDVIGSGNFDEVFSRMSLCAADTVTLENMATHCICFSGIENDTRK
jgi:cis-L-3-hydroxyproline dehydratase